MALANIDALVNLLHAVSPPTVPPAIEALPTREYAEVALAYIDNYPFTKSFNIYHPRKLTPARPSHKTLDEAGRLRYKITLSGFIRMDRTMFQSLDASLDPEMARRDFIRREIFEKRSELEDQGSKYWALLELVQSRNRTPSAQHTPLTNNEKRELAMANLRKRDNYRCRLSGFQLENITGSTEDIQNEVNPLPVYHAPLEVVHGLPYDTGKDAWAMLSCIIGLSLADCITDHESNAILLHKQIHDAFTNFNIYFELNANNDMVVRYRTQPSGADVRNDFSILPSIRRNVQDPTNPRWRDPSGSSCDTGFRIPIPNISSFTKSLGDVFWLVAASQPEVLWRREDDDGFEAILSEHNVFSLEDRLDRLTQLQAEGKELEISARVLMCP
ncbi:hypothetical protein B0H11DRAFT_2056120 [Mycena galericulata]|nr:hypothetical protein B0H11DRAFT_2056120 [Mycena galericulata]